MPQSLASILVHLIFSTKNRKPLLEPGIETELHPYLATIFKSLDSPSLVMNNTRDHIHILFRLGRKASIADVVEEVKSNSSKWMKTKGPKYRAFYWQNGYGAFSIGESGVAGLRRGQLRSFGAPNILFAPPPQGSAVTVLSNDDGSTLGCQRTAPWA